MDKQVDKQVDKQAMSECARCLHELVIATYYAAKAEHPTLVSDLLVQARVKATEAIKSALALQKKGKKVSLPMPEACPPRYNLHTYKLDWENQTVRMSTTGGRQTIRFTVPDYSVKYAGFPLDAADLVERAGRWWLHVVVSVSAPEVLPTQHVVGVALGIVRPAVTSQNQFLGKRAWKAIEGRLFHLKRKLQRKGTVGQTASAQAAPETGALSARPRSCAEQAADWTASGHDGAITEYESGALQ